MKGSSDHILSLVNDLLDFQRLESGEMEVHSVPFRVPALFDEIYTSFQPIAEASTVCLEPETGGDWASLYGRPDPYPAGRRKPLI